MDENTKRRFDGIVELWKLPWQSISERRSYEWRVTLTVWTAFAGFIVVVLTEKLTAPKCVVCLGASLIGLAICILHVLYLKGLGERHDVDRQTAIHYEKILRELSQSSFDNDFERRLEEMRKKQATLFGDWSRRVQFCVRVILYVTVVLIVLAALP